jgi:hypothetical protein
MSGKSRAAGARGSEEIAGHRQLNGFCVLCDGFWSARATYFQWFRGERDALKSLQLA